MVSTTVNDKFKKAVVFVPLKRIPTEIKLDGFNDVIKGRIFLHDITPRGVGLFVERALEIGSRLSLVMESPRHVFLKARVTWCSLTNISSHVISSETFHFRAGLEFIFDTKEIENEFRLYCEQILKLAPKLSHMTKP